MGNERRIDADHNNIKKENSLIHMFGLLGIIHQFIRRKFSSLFPGRNLPDKITLSHLGDLHQSNEPSSE